MVVFRCSSGYFSPSYIACNNETSLTPAREKSGARAQADWEAEKKKGKKEKKREKKEANHAEASPKRDLVSPSLTRPRTNKFVSSNVSGLAQI